MVQKVAVSREFEARLRHAATGKLSLSTQQKMGTFFELGKDKAAIGEGWAPPFISCAQDTVGLQPPLPLRLLGYGTPLPFLLFRMTPNISTTLVKYYYNMGVSFQTSPKKSSFL